MLCVFTALPVSAAIKLLPFSATVAPSGNCRSNWKPMMVSSSVKSTFSTPRPPLHCVISVTVSLLFFSTVTKHEAVLSLPSFAVALIWHVPEPTAVTSPLSLTTATASLVLLHVTLLFVALSGAIVASICSFSPTVNSASVSFSVIPLTTTGFTVTSHCANTPL